MDIDSFKSAQKVVGFNQTKKAAASGDALIIYAASDADASFLAKVRTLAASHGVPLDESDTKEHLGKACGIDVGCAVCAAVKSSNK
ncbi:hypothetical protein FACS1894219_02500 [Clostridia bacterium]|nr:hypothetical protein FACS1894219_02500 [Clostridia bacterium]